MNLIGVLNVWNEAALINEAVRSLIDCDRLVVIDGVYADYPGAGTLTFSGSTDGTLDVVRELRPDARVIEPPGWQWQGEAKKRSAGFVGQSEDWYLVLDADERAHGVAALKTFIATIEADKEARQFIAWIECCIRRPEGGQRFFTGHRVFRHIDGMKYHDSHHDLRDREDRPFAPITGRMVNTFYRSAWIPAERFEIEHVRHLRPAERLDAQAQFYRTRIWK